MKCNTKYKDIKIEKIPEEWTVYEISDVAEVIGGGTPSTKVPEYWGGDISWITPKDLANFEFRYIKKGVRNITKKGLDDSSAKILPKNTVLLTTRAPVGYLAIADNEITTNQGFRSLVPKRRTKSEFLFYLFKNNIAVLKANATGTTFGELSGSVLKSLKFAFPPVEEQEAITKVLSDLDSKIELNNQINKNLEEIAQAVFKQWFIDFEFPNENGEPYKSNGGEMVDSELGSIPKGWEIKKVGKILKTVLGGTPSRKKKIYWENGKIPWINSGKVNEYRIIEPSEYITELGLEKSSTKLLPKRTTVIAITGATLGKISLLEIDCFANQSIVGILENNIFKSEYIYFWMINIIDSLISWQTGGAQQHVNKDNINKVNILIPNEKILQKYYTQVRPIFNKISNNCFENKNLQQLRDLILPKLMSGEIRVPVNSKVLIN